MKTNLFVLTDAESLAYSEDKLNVVTMYKS